VQYLFATMVLTGLLQMAFGLLRFGKFIRMVPYPVMLGFVNGLAIVIFLAQFEHFKVADATGQRHWMSGQPLYVMCALIVASILIVYFLPKLTKALPSSLGAIIGVALIVTAAKIHTRTVHDMASIQGGLPAFHLPSVPFTFDTLWIVLPYAVTIAAVGLIETLLTLNLVDEITDTRGRTNRESLAQGIGNTVSGFFGAMGGCAMIGQTMINIEAGGRRRLSGITAGLLLLSFILFASPIIERIPIAALVGVMFVICARTFQWGTLRVFDKIPRSDAFVMLAVTVVTVFTNLATAVILGVILSALIFAWEHAKEISVTTSFEDGRKVYELKGTLFFASSGRFSDLFTPRQDPDEVIVEFRSARVVDHSALEAIDTLAERYQALGKTLQLRHLSPDCHELLTRAKDLVQVNLLEDPRYRVADDRIS
jgi:sulfate permease, SulP family